MHSNKNSNKLIYAVVAVEFAALLAWCYISSEHKSRAAAPSLPAQVATSEVPAGMIDDDPPLPVDQNASKSGQEWAGDPLLIPSDSQISAPDFELPDLGTGQKVRLSSEVKNHPVVFAFWTTYCEYCKMEFPVLERLNKHYGGRVAFYGINAGEDEPTVRAFLSTNRYTIPMLSDSEADAVSAYSIDEFPHVFVVGTDGKIKYDIDGYNEREGTDLEHVIDDVLRQQS